LSGRAQKAFAVLNCAALPDGLIESELFGYSRGAFTGAVQSYGGRIFGAQGGTLFLDEIGELPLGAQSKLLRFLEQKEIQRLGSMETTKVDVRVVAATNRDLERSVAEGRFRDDLYFRLSAFPVAVPALADRCGDVVKLARHFLKSGADGTRLRLSEQAAELLAAHSWPGNVRELQQVLERAVILADGETTILPRHLRFDGRRGPVARGDDARIFPATAT
jgi:two-component system response regulator FlrC